MNLQNRDYEAPTPEEDVKDHGQGAGGFGEHPDAAAPQARVDEPDRGGLAPDAVHVDHVDKRTPTPATATPFPVRLPLLTA